jgi:hypothetical protein
MRRDRQGACSPCLHAHRARLTRRRTRTCTTSSCATRAARSCFLRLSMASGGCSRCSSCSAYPRSHYTRSSSSASGSRTSIGASRVLQLDPAHAALIKRQVQGYAARRAARDGHRRARARRARGRPRRALPAPAHGGRVRASERAHRARVARRVQPAYVCARGAPRAARAARQPRPRSVARTGEDG